MGLTIHYNLTTELTEPKDVRHLVEAMRQFALDLPFTEVGQIKEFKGDDTNHRTGPDEDRWLKIQATGHFMDGQNFARVVPTHIVAFSTLPGEGCEEANFGFSRYPSYVESGSRRLATNMNGWRWGSFCKTQYASSQNCGGVENFLRCHLLVVKMLDFVKATGLAEVEVSDESDFWEKRDLKTLAETVGEWNEFLAGAVSAFRSAMDAKTIEAPITGFPNFEHLEAKGLEKLAELRKRFRKDGSP